MNWQLDTKGNLAYVEVSVCVEPDGLLFTSPINNSEYKIKGMSEDMLIGALSNLGWSNWTNEILNMVGNMGGGKWNDDPDGTQTTYEYDQETRTLTISEG